MRITLFRSFTGSEVSAIAMTDDMSGNNGLNARKCTSLLAFKR